MLAVFHPTVAAPPEEITLEGSNRSQTDSAGILKAYKSMHSGAITVEFGERCAMAYSHDQQELLRPRSLSVVDDVFCMFVGTLENLAHLRQMYGLNKSSVSEVNVIIEIYKTLRDRSPYPADQTLRHLSGAYSFVLFDNTTQTIFVAVDGQGKVPFYWGTLSDGCLAFSDVQSPLKKTCGKSFSIFPQGCYFSSADGLLSYEHPLSPVTAMPRIDSTGQVCGATFKVDPMQKQTLRASSFPRVGSESWNPTL